MSSGVLAVMQPYVFPYIGYFNLMKCASHFVLYNDVKYIKQGWINRNRVMTNDGPNIFTIPVTKVRQDTTIDEIKAVNLERFRTKFLKTLEYAYAKSKYFDAGVEYVDKVLSSEKSTISEIAKFSITCAAEMFDIDCKVYESSKQFSDTKGMERSERLIHIARKLNCSSYINSAGGSFLYEKEQFKDRGVNLKFIKPNFIPYEQINSKEFVPALSIIDLLMNQSIDEIKSHLYSYELI